MLPKRKEVAKKQSVSTKENRNYKGIKMRYVQMKSPQTRNILPNNTYVRKLDLNQNGPTSYPMETFKQRSLGSHLMLKQQGTYHQID